MSEPTSFFTEKFLQVFLRFGIGAIFAGILLGVFIGDVRADQKKNRDEHSRIEQEIAAMKNVMGQTLMSQERMVYLQRRLCINTAKTATDREACALDRER